MSKKEIWPGHGDPFNDKSVQIKFRNCLRGLFTKIDEQCSLQKKRKLLTIGKYGNKIIIKDPFKHVSSIEIFITDKKEEFQYFPTQQRGRKSFMPPNLVMKVHTKFYIQHKLDDHVKEEFKAFKRKRYLMIKPVENDWINHTVCVRTYLTPLRMILHKDLAKTKAQLQDAALDMMQAFETVYRISNFYKPPYRKKKKKKAEPMQREFPLFDGLITVVF